MIDPAKGGKGQEADPLADVRWIHGSPPGGPADPKVQVLRVDDDTFILRQSKDLNYEGPFLYMFCGTERALLLDTGAVPDGGVRETVDALLAGRSADGRTADGGTADGRTADGGTADGGTADGRTPDGGTADGRTAAPGYQLVVAHTHSHGDHVAGDGQFADRPGTTVVGTRPSDVQDYFGFTDWPAQVIGYDLGGRRLEVTGSPGHHDAAITVYDERTGFLLTGDTVLPGRLYVRDMEAFIASLDRLAAFTATRRVSHVLGCHVEMTTRPGRDYPLGCRYQPNEAPLQLTLDRLLAVRDAAHQVKDRPGVHTFSDFAIYNGPCTRAMRWQMARGLASVGLRKLTLRIRPVRPAP